MTDPALDEAPRRRSHRWLRATGLAGLLLLVSAMVIIAPIAWLAIVDPFGGAQHPTDEQLLQQLTTHRTELEQVVAMARQDLRLQRLAPDFTRPENPGDAGISPDRVKLYRQLLQTTGIANGMVNADGAMFFLVNARGLAIAGSAKGFIYREDPDPDARVVTFDLDSEEVRPKGELLMRHVDGNWWLALETR
jgi:hypothetical protein